MLNEFKTFITKGNVMNLAVGIIIGAAFTAIVNSLVGDIITPLLGLILGQVNFSGLYFSVGDAVITYGKFIQSIITFLLTAIAVFFIVKVVNSLQNIGRKEDAPAAPTTKTCPFCMTEIHLDATRCPHCTSELR